MKTKSEQRLIITSQSGNVLVYVLIAVVLFAGLSFSFTRQNKGDSKTQVDIAKAETYATSLIGYSAQVKSVLDQMAITGSTPQKLDFSLPSDEDFNNGSPAHKVYHPAGGGLMPYILDKGMIVAGVNPPSAVYLGTFNNTEWTPSPVNDVMLAAYGIPRAVCEAINKKIIGNTSIPTLSEDPAEFFVDAAFHNRNSDFNESVCPSCLGQLMLCVGDSANKVYTFYTIVAPR